MRNAFCKALLEIAEKDDKIIFLTADLGYKIFDDFKAKFPDRFINVGIAEANMVGLAAGLALEGFKPWIYSIVPFATMRCFEQIRNDVVFNCLDVKIVGVGGGYSYGFNGPTHHSVEDIAILRTLPDLTILCPGDPNETDNCVKALSKLIGPAYLRLGRAGERVVHPHKPTPDFHIGVPTVYRDGDDICIYSTGNMLATAMDAADILDYKGISCKVVSVHTMKPIDVNQLLKHCFESSLVVSLEEHGEIGGLGSVLREALANRGVHFIKFAIPDRLNKAVGDQAHLRSLVGLDAKQIAKELENLR